MLTTLQRLLPMAEKIIDRRSSLPILKHICITDGRAMFTDLESILMMPVPDTRSFTIPVGLLKKVLAAKPESLQFLVDDKKMVSILYGDKLVTYPGYDVDEYPLLPKEAFEPKGTWNWDIFKVLLTQSAYCSKDGLKPALNGVHVVQEDGQFKSESTDGHALRIQNGIDVGKSKALDSIIPTKPLALLARVARGNTKIGLSDTHLSFSLPGDVTLYVRTINEPYPAVMDVVPKKFTGEALLDRDKVLALIKAAKPFVQKGTGLSVLSLQKDKGKLSINNLEENISWEATLPVSERKGDEVAIGFDLALFERTLVCQQTAMVRWQYSSPNTASVFTEVGENWNSGALALLMPIRLKEEKSDEKCSDRPSAEA